VPLMQPVAQKIADHPCRSKNKADVSDFEPLLSDLFLVLHEKIHLMQSLLQTDFLSSESLLQARNTFVAPMEDLQPIIGNKKKGKEKKPAKDVSKTLQAGARWTVEDDLRLRELFQEGTPIAQLSKEFGRTNGAIRSRLKKLGLVE